MLGVLLLFKISRNLIEFKPFKKSCELIFSLIRIVFLKKSSNFKVSRYSNGHKYPKQKQRIRQI